MANNTFFPPTDSGGGGARQSFAIGGSPFQTYAAMLAYSQAHPDELFNSTNKVSYAIVSNDTDPKKNGTYEYSGQDQTYQANGWVLLSALGAADIKRLYESNPNTNAFTNADSLQLSTMRSLPPNTIPMTDATGAMSKSGMVVNGSVVYSDKAISVPDGGALTIGNFDISNAGSSLVVTELASDRKFYNPVSELTSTGSTNVWYENYGTEKTTPSPVQAIETFTSGGLNNAIQFAIENAGRGTASKYIWTIPPGAAACDDVNLIIRSVSHDHEPPLFDFKRATGSAGFDFPANPTNSPMTVEMPLPRPAFFQDGLTIYVSLAAPAGSVLKLMGQTVSLPNLGSQTIPSVSVFGRPSSKVYLVDDSTVVKGLRAGTPNVKIGAKDEYGIIELSVTTSDYQLQADWLQSNNAAYDYIKNKPTIPTRTGDLLNNSVVGDVIAGRRITINKLNPRTPVLSVPANSVFNRSVDLAIGSSNWATYEGSTVFFTHSSGTLNLTIDNTAVSPNYAICVGHKYPGAKKTYVTISVTGATIEGKDSATISANTCFRLVKRDATNWAFQSSYLSVDIEKVIVDATETSDGNVILTRQDGTELNLPVGTSGYSSRITALESSVSTLGSNVAQKISGVSISDPTGSAYADIKNFTLGSGLRLSNQSGQSVQINAEQNLGVSTGQTQGSQFFSGIKTIEFPGAQVSTRNNGEIAVIYPQDIGATVSYSGASLNNIKKFVFSGSGISIVPTSGDSSSVDITVSSSGGAGLTLPIADQSLSVGANKLEFMHGKILEDGQGGVQYTPAIQFRNQDGTSGGAFEVDAVVVQKPLKIETSMQDPNLTEVNLLIDENAYEPAKAPSFLAYITQETEIIAAPSEKGHNDGKIWFDGVSQPAGPFVVLDRARKAIGIQEADRGDPNVTGGTDYLVAVHIHMAGVASDDGTVRLYLYDPLVAPIDLSNIIKDINGREMSVQRQYAKGQELGTLDLFGVLNAKQLREFTVHLVNDFTVDGVVIDDPYRGKSSLLVQALTDTETTSAARSQYSLDSGLVINEGRRLMGEGIAEFAYLIPTMPPVQESPSSYGFTLSDGFGIQINTPSKVGSDGFALSISDDGTNALDFNLHRIFSAEDTMLLSGKQIRQTVVITAEDNAYVMALLKWTGAADAYTKEIFTTRSAGNPVFQNGWVFVDKLDIGQYIGTADRSLSKDFTVPADAKNFAVVLYPLVAKTPSNASIKDFKTDVVNPFVGYSMKAVTHIGQDLPASSLLTKRLVQDNEGFSILRYTINRTPIYMPIGVIQSGRADITVDSSVNALYPNPRVGEGALRFGADGDAIVNTQVRVWSDKAAGTSSVMKIYYGRITGSGNTATFAKILDSELVISVKGGTKETVVSLPAFTVSVKTGDRIGIRAEADVDDGAYLQCVDRSRPMVDTTVSFKEVIASTPFKAISFAGFNATYQNAVTATKEVTNASSVTIPIDVPAGVNIVVLSAIKQATGGVVRPVLKLDWSYNSTAKTLNVSFGETVTAGRVTIGFYL